MGCVVQSRAGIVMVLLGHVRIASLESLTRITTELVIGAIEWSRCADPRVRHGGWVAAAPVCW
jgi:hypothetical protein